jgi:hypothetical protein
MRCVCEYEYVSTHSHSWHCIEVSGDLHYPAAVLSGKDVLVPTEQQAMWAPEQCQTPRRR